MPNMDRILFVVRVDYLLDDGKVLSGNKIKEYIDIKQYVKVGKCRSKCNSIDKVN